MAAFSGTNLKSTTLEDAALEIATQLQIREADTALNPNGLNVCQLNFDTDRLVARIQIEMPITITVNGTTGATEIKAKTYLG